MHNIRRYDTICLFTILVLVILFSHNNVGFSLHFSTSMVQSHIQLAKVVHHKHYKCIQQEYLRVWQYLLYFCLTNFGKRSLLFRKVTYVTAIIRTWYMIQKSSHHTYYVTFFRLKYESYWFKLKVSTLMGLYNLFLS